jgi:hypothetical protein
LVREDFMLAEWGGPPENSIGHWRCVIPGQAASRPRPLETDSLLEDFQRLIEQPNLQQEKMCYVLALWLLQRRRLTLDGKRHSEDGSFLLLSGTRGEGPFEVRELPLDEAEANALQASLTDHLRATG